MEPRIAYAKVAPDGIKAMAALSTYLAGCGLEKSLLDLVYVRASQINGCAYCVDMHTKDAGTEGETELGLYELNAWRETPFYTERERATLAWAEAETLISETHAPDELYEEVRNHFSETELVYLTLAIAAKNGLNRVAISFGPVPGNYHLRRELDRRNRPDLHKDASTQ